MRKVSHYEARWRDKRQTAVGASAADPITVPEEADPSKFGKSEVQTSPSSVDVAPAIETPVDPPSQALPETASEVDSTAEFSVEPDQPGSSDEVRGDEVVEETADDEPEEVSGTAPGDAAAAPSERRRRRRRRRQGGAAPAA